MGLVFIRQASRAIREMADDLEPAAKGLEPVLQRVVVGVCNLRRRHPRRAFQIFVFGGTWAHGLGLAKDLTDQNRHRLATTSARGGHASAIDWRRMRTL